MSAPTIPVPVPEAPASRAVRLVLAKDLEARSPEYLIGDVLEAGTLALIFGDPGAGKTFCALAWAFAVAIGGSWCGHAVEKSGPVIYVAGEGHGGFARRIHAIAHDQEIVLDDVPLAVTTGPVPLGDAEKVQELMASIDELVASTGAPAMIVVDTVARNFGPGDENSTMDMGRFIAACDELIQRYQCTLLLVHHTGHGDKTRHRGAMALKGALDAEYRLCLHEGGQIELRAQKMKDAPLPDPVGLRLREVDLPGLQMADGSAVTSVVLDPSDVDPAHSTPALGANQRKALQVLRELDAKQRANIEAAGREPDAVRVLLDDWRAACVPELMPRNRWYEVRTALKRDGHIETNELHVWLT
ncbi:AAA family ATPase [Thioalkalivibrio sp. ALE31]|uniref:AAA family ATPase n=1 Tax=Thioalkalivibrio sp. ALE31 TaxID=1158182 RepID=UPI0004780C00|nr:AAA family ATPase [Thioalkalivibrio sp. ALE31]